MPASNAASRSFNLGTWSLSSLRPDERRSAERVSLNERVRLVAREVDGIAFDVSETGARVAVWARGPMVGGRVLLSVAGGAPRPAIVRWAQTHSDGSILGLEFASAVHAVPEGSTQESTQENTQESAKESTPGAVDVDIDIEVVLELDLSEFVGVGVGVGGSADGDYTPSMLPGEVTNIRPVPVAFIS